MLQEQPKPADPPWRDDFTISTPAPAISLVSGEDPADIWLAQSGRKEFRLHSKITFTGVTGLEGKLSPASLENIRSVDPASLPSTDLASVPGPLRWFINSYGAHTPAALIHDRLIGIENGPPDLTDAMADRYFRFMLEAVGVSWLRRWMMWAAVAFRTRWSSGPLKRVGMVLWLLLAVVGMSTAIVAAVNVQLWLLAGAVGLAGAASALWGRQFGAGLVAAGTAIWVLPPAVLAILGYLVYRLLEGVARWLRIGGTNRNSLTFRLDPADPS